MKSSPSYRPSNGIDTTLLRDPELIEECAARKGGRRSEKPRSAPQTELTEVSEVKSLERAQVMHAKAPWVQSNPLLRAKEIYDVLLHSMKTKLGAIEKL